MEGKVMESSIEITEFLDLPLDATTEKIVSTLERYAEEERAIDRKALPVIRRRREDYTKEHYQRMLLASCRGYDTQMKRGRAGNALEYSNVFVYLYMSMTE